MRGSGAFRTSAVPGGALAGPWVRNPLWRDARAVPSLDLDFANNKSLTDRVTSQNLVTHTRASSATFVDSSGVLRSAVTNLLLQSENFGTTWTTTGLLAFGSGSTLNATVAPDGQTTADLVTENTSTSEHRIETPSISWAASTTYTLSIFAKANGRTRMDFFGVGGGNFTGGRNASFNLSTGTVITTDGAVAFIEPRPNGWYRVRMTFTTSAAPSASSLFIRFLDNSSNFSYTGDGTSGIYLWGAQLEQASTVGDYVPTTSVINSAPRFDHNPTTGESLGLLVEEARTNSVVNSNSMTAVVTGSPGTLPTGWGAQGNTNGWTREVVGSGSIGALNYVDIRFSGTPTNSQFSAIFQSQGVVAASNGQSWAASVYYQLVGGSLSNVIGYPAANLWNSSSGYLSGLSLPSSLIPTSSLQRYSGSGTISQVNTAFISWGITFVCTIGTTYDFTLRFAGPQLELGAFATSFVPTTGTAVTRAADVASITGSNFGTTRTNLLLRSEAIATSPWVSANVTVTNNTSDVLDPAGGVTSTKVVATGSSSAFFQSITLAATTYVGSIWLRCATGTISAQLIVYLGGSPFTNIGTTNVTITTSWQRFSVITSTATAVSYNFQLHQIAAGTIYAWGAQLETGSAATPYIPSTTTFTSRASGASYFDAAGVLQWKPQNLLLRSEEFDNTGTWSRTGLSTVTANAAVAPDGSTTADALVEDASTGTHRVFAVPASLLASTPYSLSVYVKASTRNIARVEVRDSAGAFSAQDFDLTTQVVTNAGSGTGTISSVGNGWFRCTVNGTSSVSGGVGAVLIYSMQVVGNANYTGTNGTSAILIWGAQLEQRAGSFAVPGEYTPTVATATGGARNSAFLPDSSGVFRSAGPLLLEEARSNVLTQSEAFSTGWVGSGYTTSTAAITSPSGQSGVYSANEVSTAASQHYLAYLYSIPGSTPYTFSFFAKANQRNNISLRYYFADNNWVARVFDLSGSGALTQSSAGAAADVTSISQSIVSCPNGWYRISLTLTQPTTRSAYFSIDGCITSTPTLDAGPGIQLYTGDVNKGYYLWGAQEEAGSFPSSYIPTATSQVTRAADVSTSTATSVFESSWYNQTEGTVYHQGRAPTAANFFSIDDGTVNNRITSYMTSATAPFLFVQTGGAAIANLTSSAITAGSLFAQADAYKATDFAISTNGGTVSTASTGAVPVVNKMVIGANVGGSAAVNGAIKRLTYWPTRLSNTTLQQITQP